MDKLTHYNALASNKYHVFLLSRLRLEFIFLSIAYLGIVLEVLLGIVTLWIFQKSVYVHSNNILYLLDSDGFSMC